MNNDFKIFQVRIPNFLALALMAPEILGFLSVYQRLKITFQEILVTFIFSGQIVLRKSRNFAKDEMHLKGDLYTEYYKSWSTHNGL